MEMGEILLSNELANEITISPCLIIAAAAGVLFLTTRLSSSEKSPGIGSEDFLVCQFIGSPSLLHEPTAVVVGYLERIVPHDRVNTH